MTRNIVRSLGLAAIAAGLPSFVGCNLLQISLPPGGSSATLAVFVDPNNPLFSTTDVRDVDGEIVQFDTTAKTIIWKADGTAFEGGDWDVNGYLLKGGSYQVRFGTQDGERRAYFTDISSAKICQIAKVGADLSITATSVAVPQEAVFDDPDSDFSTSDVRDVDEQIVRFDTSTNSIIWAEDGTAYQQGQWTVNDVFLAGGAFQVRFGTREGERRAYFTETGPATICQIEPVNGFLSITSTNETVPQ